MTLAPSSFRVSKASQRRWQAFPEIDSMILNSYMQMELSTKQEMTLNVSLLQDINQAVLSFAGTRYPIRTISSILNKLHADHCEFIKYLESVYKIADGYDFLSARLETDYFEGIESYACVLSEMTMEQISSLMSVINECDLSKQSITSLHKNVRKRSLSSQDKVSLKSDLLFAINNFPEVFADIEKFDVINNPAIKEIIVDLVMDKDFEIDTIWANFYEKVLDFFSKTMAEFFVDRINAISCMSDVEKKTELLNVFHERLFSTPEPVVDYVHEVIMTNKEKIDPRLEWVQEIACEWLLKKNQDWAYYSLGGAAIVYNASPNGLDAISAFLNALDRDSILNDREIEGIIDYSKEDRTEIFKTYGIAFDAIFDLVRHKPLYNSTDDSQNRLLQFSIATGTEKAMFDAYFQSFCRCVSKAQNNEQRRKINEMMESAKTKFDISVDKLSPSNRRLLLETDLSL